jgi:hypothetical protein
VNIAVVVRASHPLLGRVWSLAEWQVEEAVQRWPPTPEAAQAIAREELRRPVHLGGDRPGVYRALAAIPR